MKAQKPKQTSSALSRTNCSPSFGGKADFQCESCGISPTWGMARGNWWLTCDCWQTEVGSHDAVLANWRKDRQKRIKANASVEAPSA